MYGTYKIKKGKKGPRAQSAKPGVINLTDLIRIQREIIPSINEERNRKLYDEKLKEKSKAHILNFKGEGLRVDKSNLGYYYDKMKTNFINEEMRKRKIDEIEKEYQMNEKKTVNDRAKKILFQNQDDIKEFRSKMMLSDCMNERKYQQEIKKLKKATNDYLEEIYHAQDLENMAKYDKKEQEKLEKMQKKKTGTDENNKLSNGRSKNETYTRIPRKRSGGVHGTTGLFGWGKRRRIKSGERTRKETKIKRGIYRRE